MARAIKRSRCYARNKQQHLHKLCFVDLPLDVLFEIFLLLQPAELLYLSRTTKDLRAFLLNPSRASSLWKNAISSVGLPPCPSWMSPPAYAFLAVDPLCHGCYGTCETIQWELRMRCCTTCSPKMLTKQYSSTIKNLKPPVAGTFNFELRDKGRSIYFRKANNPYARAYSLLDWKLVRYKRPAYISLGAFVAQKNELWDSVRSHAKLCRDWECEWLNKRADCLRRARHERVQDIKSKLAEMGCFQTVISFCDCKAFWSLPEVKKFGRLTSEEWKEIHPQLIRWLKKALCRDRRCALEDKFSWNGLSPVQPRPVDVAAIPAVRSALEPHIISDMSNLVLMKKLTRVLPRAIRKWSRNTIEELEEMARQELDLPQNSKPSTLLPVIFRCRTCRQRLRFNEALFHEHLYKVKPKSHSARKIPAYEVLLRDYPTYPRSNQVLRVDVIASRRVEDLVRQLGQDPSTVEYDVLAESYVTSKMVCSLCHPKFVTAMDFGYAFQHCLDSHPGKNESEIWTCNAAAE